MALKRAYTEGKATELVANCEVLSEQIDIQSMIKTVRGQQVILDRDLATLYGVENRVLNQAVKRNSERFPEDFMFQLNKAEDDDLKSQNVTSSWGGRRKLPYAFTEQGIAMLSSVLRSPMAIDVNMTASELINKIQE
ncbi:MAG: ORF6N domain-containing protein [Prevotella nanceiensis]|nr:ORF6N domain-containing protein [Hoylesella nanceiensis]